VGLGLKLVYKTGTKKRKQEKVCVLKQKKMQARSHRKLEWGGVWFGGAGEKRRDNVGQLREEALKIAMNENRNFDLIERMF